MKWTEKLKDVLLSKMPLKKDGVQRIVAEVGETSYYREYSVRYATAQMLLLMALAVFLAVSLLTGKDRLSVENLSLLISDLENAVIMPETGEGETVTYVADENNDFVSYRGGLSVLGGERLTVFTATGRENYAVSLRYHTPQLLTSGKYLLAYDQGGRDLTVYNSFTNLFQTQMDSPIRSVAVSSAGYFAVITDDGNLAGCVTLYDGDFDVISRLHLKEHTVCAAISDQGDQLCVASVSAEAGQMKISLLFAIPGKSEVLSTLTLYNTYPISMEYTEHGLLLLCTDAVYAIDRAGNITGEYTFDSTQVLFADLNSHGAVITVRANNYSTDSRVIAIDTKGTVAVDALIDGSVTDAVWDRDEIVYVLTPNTLYAYGTNASEADQRLELREQYATLLPLGDGDVYLCGQARAVCVYVASPKS